MQTINTFDRQNLKQLREALQNAMNEVTKNFGLDSIQLGNIRFDSNQFKSAITAKTKTTVAQSVNNNLQLSQLLGFNHNIVGTSRKQGRTTYTVTKIDLKKRKFPIIVVTDNGASYKLSEAQFNLMAKC